MQLLELLCNWMKTKTEKPLIKGNIQQINMGDNVDRVELASEVMCREWGETKGETKGETTSSYYSLPTTIFTRPCGVSGSYARYKARLCA